MFRKKKLQKDNPNSNSKFSSEDSLKFDNTNLINQNNNSKQRLTEINIDLTKDSIINIEKNK